jgi:histidinol-phosphate aminotransferase
MRVGYGIGPAALVEEMNKVRTPFNTSGVGQAAALAALGDVEHVRRSVESNRAGMAQVSQALDRLGVKFVPSFGNFIYLEAGANGRALSDAMLERGVIVRPLDWMGMADGVRVTIGTADENAKFLKALSHVLKTQPVSQAR